MHETHSHILQRVPSPSQKLHMNWHQLLKLSGKKQEAEQQAENHQALSYSFHHSSPSTFPYHCANEVIANPSRWWQHYALCTMAYPVQQSDGALPKGPQVPKYDLKLGLPGLSQVLAHHGNFSPCWGGCIGTFTGGPHLPRDNIPTPLSSGVQV